jgi:hypothetical protein
MTIGLIFSIVAIAILSLAVGFCILVVMGNLSAMKFLAKNGVAVFSHNIVKDCKLLNYVNKEGACWLSIPDVCYSPVMENCDGKYKKHNFLQKPNKYGELYLSDSKRAMKLQEFSIPTNDKIKDLTIIRGNPRGNGTDLRHANFSLLRKIQHHIKDGSVVTLCEDGKVRYFKPISMLEMGIDDNFTFKYNDRYEFLKSVLFLSKVNSMRDVPKEPVIILECKTDIDIVVVVLVEVKKK